MLRDAPPCCPLTTAPLTPDEAEAHAAAFKVLADPARLQILSLIATEGCAPATVGALTEKLGLSQPTVSHHLKKLADAGFLTRHKEGRTVTHAVEPGTFAVLRTVLSIG